MGSGDLLQRCEPIDNSALEKDPVIGPAVIGCNVDGFDVVASLSLNGMNERVGLRSQAVVR